MNWDEDHRRRVDAFPADIQKAHDHSSDHRAEIADSTICGCFYCCAVFPPQRIEEWVDQVDGEGQTALCPMCGIDSVIGDKSAVPISVEFLKRMKAHWF